MTIDFAWSLVGCFYALGGLAFWLFLSEAKMLHGFGTRLLIVL